MCVWNGGDVGFWVGRGTDIVADKGIRDLLEVVVIIQETELLIKPIKQKLYF